MGTDTAAQENGKLVKRGGISEGGFSAHISISMH